MKAQRRSAETRKRNREVRQAALIDAALPGEKRNVAQTRRLIQILAGSIASAAPSALTFDGPQGVLLEELYTLLGRLNRELGMVAWSENRLRELRLEHPHAAAGESHGNVIAFRPRGAQ